MADQKKYVVAFKSRDLGFIYCWSTSQEWKRLGNKDQTADIVQLSLNEALLLCAHLPPPEDRHHIPGTKTSIRINMSGEMKPVIFKTKSIDVLHVEFDDD